MSTETRDWGDLTYEALVEIFKNLEFEDRFSTVPRVCKGWLRAARDGACCEVVDMSQAFARRQESRRWWQPEFEMQVDNMIMTLVNRSAGRVRELHASHCSDLAIFYVAERCPGLEVLCIPSSAGVTDSSLLHIAKNCQRLHTLDISECLYVSEESLKYFGDSILVLKRNMLDVDDDTRRRFLQISYSQMCHYAHNADGEARLFATLMPKLKHLEMRHSRLSDEGLHCIVEGCFDLEHLDLLWCNALTRQGRILAKKGLPKLKVLMFPSVVPVRALQIAPRPYGHWQLYSNERFENDFFQY